MLDCVSRVMQAEQSSMARLYSSAQRCFAHL